MGMPIKKIIHKLYGTIGNRYFNERNNDKIDVHIKKDIIIVFVIFFLHTAVNTNKIIKVIGSA